MLPNPIIRVRDAVNSDARDIARIYIVSWNEGFGNLMPHRELTTADETQWLKDISKSAPHRWWVAETEGSVIGFAGICPSRDPIDPALGELDTIAVNPRHWRIGAGRILMATVLHHLETDGYREGILWTLANYPRGQRFYEAMGWRLDGGSRKNGSQVSYRHTVASR